MPELWRGETTGNMARRKRLTRQKAALSAPKQFTESADSKRNRMAGAAGLELVNQYRGKELSRNNAVG
jgi:hypothetical protein